MICSGGFTRMLYASAMSAAPTRAALDARRRAAPLGSPAAPTEERRASSLDGGAAAEGELVLNGVAAAADGVLDEPQYLRHAHLALRE